MKNLRILFIDAYFRLPDNTLKMRTYSFARRLAEKGHFVSVICGNFNFQLQMKDSISRDIREDKINITVINTAPKAEKDAPSGELSYNPADTKTKKGSEKLFLSRVVEIASQKERFDVIVARTAPFNAAYAALKICKKFKSPLILDVEEFSGDSSLKRGAKQDFSVKGLLTGLSEKKLYEKAAGIIAISPLMISGILQRQADMEKIEYIPHFADLEAFKIGEDQKKDFKFLKKHGIKNNFINVFVGKAHKGAGLEYFLGAAALHSASDISWVVAGSGSALPELKKQVQEAGLNEQVIFLDSLSHEGIKRLLGCADVLTLLYRKTDANENGDPGHFFYCLSAGKPIITNISGWTAELLQRYNAGIVVPHGSFREIARNVGSLSNKPDLVKVMGENARILAAEKFDFTTIFSQFEAVLMKVCRS